MARGLSLEDQMVLDMILFVSRKWIRSFIVHAVNNMVVPCVADVLYYSCSSKNVIINTLEDLVFLFIQVDRCSNIPLWDWVEQLDSAGRVDLIITMSRFPCFVWNSC